MPTDVATFDPKSIQDKITDRIRSSFVELVPEAAWQAMVKKEIDWFTADTQESHYYSHNERKPGPLRLLIRECLEAMFKDMLKTELAKPEYQDHWNGNMNEPGVAVKKIIHESLPRLAEVAFGVMVQAAIQTLQNSR